MVTSKEIAQAVIEAGMISDLVSQYQMQVFNEFIHNNSGCEHTETIHAKARAATGVLAFLNNRLEEIANG
jgi:uncharacterized PurR-regulated membrane protein YhhQ (DUF165 family)